MLTAKSWFELEFRESGVVASGALLAWRCMRRFVHKQANEAVARIWNMLKAGVADRSKYQIDACTGRSVDRPMSEQNERGSRSSLTGFRESRGRVIGGSRTEAVELRAARA